jgi:hypothetical protein
MRRLGNSAVYFQARNVRRNSSLFRGRGELSEHPKIVALRNDPDISEMIAQGRFLDLLQNQRIIDAANDPTLADRIKEFDLQRALDYAVEQK